MQKFYLKAAAFSGALAVTLGAFGAHSLRQFLNDKYLAVFETAVRYQFYHTFALLAAGILFKEFSNVYMLWSGRLFCCGTVLFCGSLYLLTLLEAMGRQNFKWIGAITPFGGLCLIGGWVLMAFSLFNNR